MRPLDDAFASSMRPRSKPSSVASRSPSPGTARGLGMTGGNGGGMTYFLTEENNFGVHSMSESHLASPTTSSPPVETEAETSFSADQGGDAKLSPQTRFDSESTFAGTLRKTDKAMEKAMETIPIAGGGVSAIPPHVYGHTHTPSIGSNMSSTFSTPGSPQQNLSSSAISDDSELDLSSHHEEEAVAPDSASTSFPQLVMPRVSMPRRKPFTEAGRTMGRLKVMVVGDSGMYIRGSR